MQLLKDAVVIRTPAIYIQMYIFYFPCNYILSYICITNAPRRRWRRAAVVAFVLFGLIKTAVKSDAHTHTHSHKSHNINTRRSVAFACRHEIRSADLLGAYACVCVRVFIYLFEGQRRAAI